MKPEEEIAFVVFAVAIGCFAEVLFALPLAILLDLCGMPPYDSVVTPIVAITAVLVAYSIVMFVVFERLSNPELREESR